MEERVNINQLLDQIPQPGFLVQSGQILHANQAAAAMMLAPGQAFCPMVTSGMEDYQDLQDGQICLTLTIGDRHHNAVVSRMGGYDVVLLDAVQAAEEFRSMALVSMELRGTLMQAISSARQMDASNDAAAAKMNQSLMQMLRLVSNMGDISRYTASARMELRDVDAFLLELFDKAQTLTEGRVSIRFEGLRQPVFSRIDPEQLERAVWNILSNCIKFLPDGGKIHAVLTRQGNRLRLTVEDSGSGIAESVRANLFSRYLRQPGIEDSRYGLGLGLAIVRTVAANHEGTVLISTAATGGTKIAMTLAIRTDDSNSLHSPVFRPDYTGGWDHGLVELSDCLDSQWYQTL